MNDPNRSTPNTRIHGPPARLFREDRPDGTTALRRGSPDGPVWLVMSTAAAEAAVAEDLERRRRRAKARKRKRESR